MSRTWSRLVLAAIFAPAVYHGATAQEPTPPTPDVAPPVSPAPQADTPASAPNKSNVLPDIHVTAPIAKPRSATATAPVRARRSAGTPTTRAPAQPAAAQVPASGAPNVGGGPRPPPGLASQMTVSGDDLNARPVTRPGELLEAAPGLSVTQHSGEGKANQYFLRGFNLDHGTDLAISVDDMPINLRTHAHGQG